MWIILIYCCVLTVYNTLCTLKCLQNFNPKNKKSNYGWDNTIKMKQNVRMWTGYICLSTG